MKFGRGRMKFAVLSAAFLVMFQVGTGMFIRGGGGGSLGGTIWVCAGEVVMGGRDGK